MAAAIPEGGSRQSHRKSPVVLAYKQRLCQRPVGMVIASTRGMSTIYLLDALFLLIAGMAALFAFGVVTSRFTGTFKVIFFIFFGLFVFTLLIGYLPQTKEVYDPEQARMEESGADGK
jgi:uncharacterized membrane protein YtjA (UPF0391 family)